MRSFLLVEEGEVWVEMGFVNFAKFGGDWAENCRFLLTLGLCSDIMYFV